MEQTNEESVVANDAAVVVMKKEKSKKQLTESSDAKYKVPAEDMISTLFTYVGSPVKKGNFKNGGKCLLCGVGTASADRKICWECLTAYRDEIVAE
jgi:phosphoheptose isomerase